jgi:hypothetical protein
VTRPWTPETTLNEEVGEGRATVATERMAAVLAEITSNGDLTEALARQAADAVSVSGLGAVLTTSERTAERLVLRGDQHRIVEPPVDAGRGSHRRCRAARRSVLEPDLADAQATTRWPAFVSAAGGLGLGAVFAFPLRIGAIVSAYSNCTVTHRG